MSFAIRPMRLGDIGDGMRLKRAARWNQTEDDWRLFLTVNPEGCFAAEQDGRVVGTVTTIVYGGRVAWIGMVLVDPEFRRRGIARRLMETAIEHLAGCPVLKLDATPEGRHVYAGMGFENEYGLRRLTVETLPPVTRSEGEVSPVAPEAVERIVDLEAEVFGADRGAVVRAFCRNAPDLAWQLTEGGKVKGFCLGRRGSTFVQIGPLVAGTLDQAVSLCRAVLGGLGGRAVVLDVPDAQALFRKWLLGLGFAEQRPFIRMFRGENRYPGIPDRRFAIAGPEIG